MSAVWRQCIKCKQAKEKSKDFAESEWECNICHEIMKSASVVKPVEVAKVQIPPISNKPPRFVQPSLFDISSALNDVRDSQVNVISVSQYYSAFIERLAFSDPPLFGPTPQPKRGGWLDCHEEVGQTFRSFVNSTKIEPKSQRNTIVLVLIGDPPDASIIEALRRYISAFFQLNVCVIDPVQLETINITTRNNHFTGNRQLLTGDCLQYILSVKRQESLCHSCVAAVGVTLEDLYPDPDWNFVFGQATFAEGVGVFSLARFLPSWVGDTPDPVEERKIILRRACAIMTHEIGHIFGLRHCIYFHCLMNGVNNLAELVAGTLFECPVCLKKLCESFAWDVMKRYQDMAAEMNTFDFQEAKRIMDNFIPVARRFVGATRPVSIGSKYVL
jgi:archaemetzincin